MDRSTIWRVLQQLAGTWEGTGKGEFPTISPFTYREVLEVRGDQEDALLHYQQQTWRQEDGQEVDSHRETGFIGLADSETVQILNAQGSDRVEVLRGHVEVRENKLLLDLDSVALAHDERMIRSWRRLQLEGDVLRYTMGMATKHVPDGATHLTARLTRR